MGVTINRNGPHWTLVCDYVCHCICVRKSVCGQLDARDSGDVFAQGDTKLIPAKLWTRCEAW